MVTNFKVIVDGNDVELVQKGVSSNDEIVLICASKDPLPIGLHGSRDADGTLYGVTVEAHSHVRRPEPKEVQKSKQDLETLLLNFWSNVPEIHGIAITQYTPYFNDGDVCEFGIQDLFFFPKYPKFFDIDFLDWEEKDAHGMTIHDKRAEDNDTPELAALKKEIIFNPSIRDHMVDLHRELSSGRYHDTLKANLGDHVTVALTRTRVVVEPQEHD